MDKTQGKLPYSPTWMNSVNAHPVRIYDVKTQEVLGEFKTIAGAAIFAGVSPRTVHRILKHKAKNKTNGLGKIITIRSLSTG